VDFRLDLACPCNIDIILVCLEIGNLGIGYQSDSPFGFRQCNPYPPENRSLVVFRPYSPHLGAAVAPREGGNEGMVVEGTVGIHKALPTGL